MKVPPRATFMAQAVATLLSGVLQVGVKEALFTTVPDICSENQGSMLTCPQNRVFFSASAIWCVSSLLCYLEVRRRLTVAVGGWIVGA
jgi:hypothetical protein